jgi:membrane protease YdiL (CAAX protease family)
VTAAAPATRRRAGDAPIVVAGSLLLLGRAALTSASPAPRLTLVLVFVAVLAASASWCTLPLIRVKSHQEGRATGAVALAGLVVFAVGRVLVGGHALHAPLALDALAAVAEEAFFRGVVYGAFTDAGPSAAVFGSAALFALVHVPIYGFGALPIDLAAGLVLSWQRWASGDWRVPAVTHVAVNLMMAW